ncbi:MAG TPA: hypothetical protein VFB34_08090, partial [Chloroflexota bacterium]|nr:hypothetical protein [Chloroflexota bacterium]
GAAEGMLVAGALNAITSRAETVTNAQLETKAATYKFVTNLYLPGELSRRLALINEQLFDARISGHAPVERHESLVDELERLERLRLSGALSDDEFRVAKQALLDPYRGS